MVWVKIFVSKLILSLIWFTLIFLFFFCSRMGWRYKIFGLIRRVHSFGDLSKLQFKFLSSKPTSVFSLLSQITENLWHLLTLSKLLTFLCMNARKTKVVSRVRSREEATEGGCRRLKLFTGHLDFKSAAFPWLPVSKPDWVCGREGYFRMGWLPSWYKWNVFSNCILRKEYDS